MFYYSGEANILTANCSCPGNLIDFWHTFQQTHKRQFFIKSRTGRKYTNTRMGVGMMVKRLIMPLDRLIDFTAGVGESGSTYAAITSVVWPMVLSRVPRRRKTENFNIGFKLAAFSLTVFALTYQKDAISRTTFKANGMSMKQTKKGIA